MKLASFSKESLGFGRDPGVLTGLCCFGSQRGPEDHRRPEVPQSAAEPMVHKKGG